jgi:hypothetical protein
MHRPLARAFSPPTTLFQFFEPSEGEPPENQADDLAFPPRHHHRLIYWSLQCKPKRYIAIQMVSQSALFGIISFYTY